MFPTPASLRWSRIAALTGRTATGERLGEAFRGEGPFEGLASDTGGQVGVELLRLDEKPRAEAADVSVRDIRSVV